MPSSLTIAQAELAGIVVHTLLYGVFVVLFVGTLHVLVFKNRRKQTSSGRLGPRVITNKFLFSISIILFVLITAHWIIQISRLFDAFIRFADLPGGPNAYYFAQQNPKNVAKTALYVAQTFVGDVTIIYRLYIVWGRNKFVIIPPLLSSFALLGVGSAVVWSFTTLKPGEDFFDSQSGRFILAVFGASLFTNISATVLLSYRILSINRVFNTGIRSRVMRVLSVVLESAAMYTVCLIMTHVTYLTKDAFQFIALDATSPTIGISFALIIVRVGLGVSTEAQGHAISHDSPYGMRSGISHASMLSPVPGGGGGPGVVGRGGPIPLKPLAVNVSKHVTTQIDGADEDDDSFSSRTLSKLAGGEPRSEWV